MAEPQAGSDEAEVPAVLLERCPGCGSALSEVTCSQCELGVAGSRDFWKQEHMDLSKLKAWLAPLLAGLLIGVLAVVTALVLKPANKSALPVLIPGVLLIAMCGMYLRYWVLVLAARLRKMSEWTYSVAWNGDDAEGFAQARVTMAADRVVFREGELHERSLPQPSLLVSTREPPPEQLRFVRWIGRQLGRDRVALFRQREIRWSLGTRRSRGVYARVEVDPALVRTEQNHLVLEGAGAAEELAPPVRALLTEPRPLVEVYRDYLGTHGWDGQTDEPDEERDDHDDDEHGTATQAAMLEEIAQVVLN